MCECEDFIMAKKQKQQKTFQTTWKSLIKKNKILLFVGIAAVLALFLYFYPAFVVEEAMTLEESAAVQDIIGQTQFGYMKEGYIINVDVAGKTRRIEIKTLNDDSTVDITLDRAYNVEEGETVYADYDYDGYADIGFTLDGVELYDKRFSMTLTYYGILPDEITTELGIGTLVTERGVCTDTDGGLNYAVLGEVTDVLNAVDSDRCSRSDVFPGRLYEAYCEEDGTHAREIYDCPSGVCVDGACV